MWIVNLSWKDLSGNSQYAIVCQFLCTHILVRLTKKQSVQHTHNQHIQPCHHSLLLLCIQLGMWGMSLLQQGGASTALCRLLPAQSTRQPMPHLLQMLLRRRQSLLCPGWWRMRSHLSQHPGQLLACLHWWQRKWRHQKRVPWWCWTSPLSTE